MADRLARDAQAVGKLLLGEPLARRKRALGNRIDQPEMDLLDQIRKRRSAVPSAEFRIPNPEFGIQNSIISIASQACPWTFRRLRFAAGRTTVRAVSQPEPRDNGLPCRLARPHQAVRDHRRHQQGARAESGRPRRDRPRRRRARFRHARQHQGSRDQGDPRGQDQVHRRRRHPRAQGGDRRKVQAREWNRRTSRTRSPSAPAASRCSTTR